MAGHTHPRTTAGYRREFVADVLDDALAHASHVYGIAGLQGCGKSTLAMQMATLASERGLSVVVLSIDDFYLGRRERRRLGHHVHPLLATRGPPGTHDVTLACATIDALKKGRNDLRAHPVAAAMESLNAKLDSDLFVTTALPRFDKIADRRLPPSRWPAVTQRVDLIVFEGWFLKVPPENPVALRDPVNTLERAADAQGIWRTYCNCALAAYAPLWQRIDRLLFLQGPGFEVVPEWRWQQETSLQSAHPGRDTMGREAVERFVLFFERLSRHALHTLPAIADRTIRIDAMRQPE